MYARSLLCQCAHQKNIVFQMIKLFVQCLNLKRKKIGKNVTFNVTSFFLSCLFNDNEYDRVHCSLLSPIGTMSFLVFHSQFENTKYVYTKSNSNLCTAHIGNNYIVRWSYSYLYFERNLNYFERETDRDGETNRKTNRD